MGHPQNGGRPVELQVEIPQRSERGQPSKGTKDPVVLGTDSRNDTPTSATDPPAIRELEKQQLDFVLETSLSGLNEIEIIHGANAPTLSHLMEKLCKKYMFEPHDIMGVKVKIGDRIIKIDLDDSRDWEYISRITMESGSRAGMVVSTSRVGEGNA